MRISDWSSDVCSSDLPDPRREYRLWPVLNDPPTEGTVTSSLTLPESLTSYSQISSAPLAMTPCSSSLPVIFSSPTHWLSVTGDSISPSKSLKSRLFWEPALIASDRKSTRLNSRHQC